jgi:hypothetical protein
MVSQPMATIETLPVFVSYARKDGALAQCLQSDLTKGVLYAWLDTPRIGGGALWSIEIEIEDEVDTRQATIEPLSPHSHLRRTMRASAGSREQLVSLLDLAQSRELLARWANLESAESSNEAEEVIAECGRLPLAFSIVCPMLRNMGREFWKDTLDLLHKADPSDIEEQLPSRPHFAKFVYEGLTIHSPVGPPA